MEIRNGRASVSCARFARGDRMPHSELNSTAFTFHRQIRGLQTGRGKYRGARPNDDTRLLIPKMAFRRLVSTSCVIQLVIP